MSESTTERLYECLTSRMKSTSSGMRYTMMSCLCLARFVLPLARITRTGRVDGAFSP